MGGIRSTFSRTVQLNCLHGHIDEVLKLEILQTTLHLLRNPLHVDDRVFSHQKGASLQSDYSFSLGILLFPINPLHGTPSWNKFVLNEGFFVKLQAVRDHTQVLLGSDFFLLCEAECV